MGCSRKQDDLPLTVVGKALEQAEPLLAAALGTDTSMCFIDDNRCRADPCELVATAVGLDVVEADDREGMRLEQADARWQVPFEARR